MKAHLEERFGRPEECKGRWFYGSGWVFPGGAMVFFDVLEASRGGAEHISVEVPGGALELLESNEETLELASNLMMHGLRATRVDVALDCKRGLGLIGKVIASCDAGELCGARTWQEVRGESRKGVMGHTVYLGKRGKLGSGRCVRVYDKGLESGTAKAGEWERYEVEFSGETAAEVLENVVLADEPIKAALGYIKGAVEFRRNTGDKNRKRRPLVAWYQELFGNVERRFARIARSKTTLDRYAAWMRRCVAPTMRAMELAGGVDIAELWRELVGNVPVSFDVLARPVVWEWLRRRERARCGR